MRPNSMEIVQVAAHLRDDFPGEGAGYHDLHLFAVTAAAMLDRLAPHLARRYGMLASRFAGVVVDGDSMSALDLRLALEELAELHERVEELAEKVRRGPAQA
jgi:hypothetical protein